MKRVSDRMMYMKLDIEGVMMTVSSVYAPQVGCLREEKDKFWTDLDEVVESIPKEERLVIGADFNGHVGEGNRGDENVIGRYGDKARNAEGQMLVDFATRMEMAVVNTHFKNREEHRVIYKSGGRSTHVDFIICRRTYLKEIGDCKVIVGGNVAKQHRLLVCRMTLETWKQRITKAEPMIKWLKLKKEDCCEEIREEIRRALGGEEELPDDWTTTANIVRGTARKVLGVSSKQRKEDNENWWWDEEVQERIRKKRLAKLRWDIQRDEESKQEYKEMRREAKKEVAKAKSKAYDELFEELDTKEGEKTLYRLARQSHQAGKDVQQVRMMRDKDGNVMTDEESVLRIWKEYNMGLMNEENEREKRENDEERVNLKVESISKEEARENMQRMKNGKAVGPDVIPVDVWKCLGESALKFLTKLYNRTMESERMPEECRDSMLIPIFKNKGDVQSRSNYRGIKLIGHTMKLWERIIERRLRRDLTFNNQQYGFMPGKITTDALFALRVLMEKYREGQKELHCVFVDLEKAYDKVPREEVWYCMRKSGLAEKYVRIVQDMYDGSTTAVRCAVAVTEGFEVKVGLHQGSALSPCLFAMVMNWMTDETREEAPWTMMFADDIMICSESKEQVEEKLESWRYALERRGMKVNRKKTEYMCVNERQDTGSGTVKMEGEEVAKMVDFKYLGSTVQSNGVCGREVKK